MSILKILLLDATSCIEDVEVPECISWLPGVDRILPRKDCCAAADAQPHASYEASAGFDRQETSRAGLRTVVVAGLSAILRCLCY